MENARAIWDELGLPALTPRTPWFGYHLGYGPDSWDRATRLTTAGRYLESGHDFRASGQGPPTTRPEPSSNQTKTADEPAAAWDLCCPGTRAPSVQLCVLSVGLRIVVVGAGVIGSIYGGWLARSVIR
jgi:hypothetical protein